MEMFPSLSDNSIARTLPKNHCWPDLSREMLKVDVLFMLFSILYTFLGKMLPHEDIGIKVPFVQLLQVCLGKGEHSDQFP